MIVLAYYIVQSPERFTVRFRERYSYFYKFVVQAWI